MALTTYVNLNNSASPVTMSMVDTSVSSAPYDRPSTRTPNTGYVASTTATDYGVGSTPALRAQVFEPPSWSAVIDPGLEING